MKVVEKIERVSWLQRVEKAQKEGVEIKDGARLITPSGKRQGAGGL